MEIELGKKVVLKPIYLDEEQLVKKREEKPNVFLCKYRNWRKKYYMKRIAIIADNSLAFVSRLLNAWNNDEVAVLIDYRTPSPACLEMIIRADVSEVYTDRQDLFDYVTQIEGNNLKVGSAT